MNAESYKSVRGAGGHPYGCGSETHNNVLCVKVEVAYFLLNVLEQNEHAWGRSLPSASNSAKSQID